MNFALSDEQLFLQEAAKTALSRHKTVEAAREALEDWRALPDLWPTATQAGWTGLLVPEEHGGAGLGALDAMLVLAECGRVLASVPLLGHLTATALLNGAGADAELLGRLAAGEARAAAVLARPPADPPAEGEPDGWTVEPRRGRRRAPAPELRDGRLHGEACWVPDAPGADVLVVVATENGAPRVAVVEAGAEGLEQEALTVYDATRALGHLTFEGTPAAVLDAPVEALAGDWFLAHALIAAESLGAVEECLQRSLTYAKERFTFGRPIGSYQAIKHQLTEVLRRQENARSLIYYAGWAGQSAPEEFALAASAARAAAGEALDHAARVHISVHGGIGATWEHDAPLFFRRAQLSRRLLGGTADATDRVAAELIRGAARVGV